uniref:Uncharacterized protein n=1 Tax=Oryza nivara TaxID=4536 RepID=A0A0E0INM6_ORYNI
MDEDFAQAVEDGLKLSKRLRAPARPIEGMDRASGMPDKASSLLPSAPMAYAVVVDSPPPPNQPHVYGRLDPPTLIPLHMCEFTSLEAGEEEEGEGRG